MRTVVDRKANESLESQASTRDRSISPPPEETRPFLSRFTIPILLVAGGLYLVITYVQDFGALSNETAHSLKFVTVLVLLLPCIYSISRIVKATGISWTLLVSGLGLVLSQLCSTSFIAPHLDWQFGSTGYHIGPGTIKETLGVISAVAILSSFFLSIERLLTLVAKLKLQTAKNQMEIAEHVRTKAELQESKEQVSTLTEGTSAAIFMIRDGICLYANPAAERLLGVTRQELGEQQSNFWERTGLSQFKFLETCPSADAQVSRHPLPKVSSILTGRRETRWVEITASTIHSRAIPTLLLTVHDVTRRTVAEADLRLNEELLRNLTEFLPGVSIQGYRPDGTVFFWNRESEGIYGYTPDEAIGRDLGDLIIPPDLLPAFRESLAIGAEATQSGEFMPASESVLKDKDGGPVPVYSVHTAVCLEGREPSLYCIDMDLSQLKASEEKRTNLERQLAQSQKMEALGQLAGGVAHDFNNILTSIMIRSELLVDQYATNHNLCEEIVQIQKATERASTLTRQLLLFSRRSNKEVKEVDLNTVVAEMEKLLSRLLPENIKLDMQLDSDSSVIRSDTAQIEQVILNLVINARDAVRDGGDIVVTTSNEDFQDSQVTKNLELHPGNYVVLTVSDTGCGMDKETTDRVFEPFFTTKKEGKGTGLGLATVYGIVKRSNGCISVYSEPMKGTTFKVYIPTCEAPTAKEESDSSEETMTGGTESVLIVEDDQDIRVVAHAILERRGYDVLEAESGEKGLEVFLNNHHKIDLVLSDVVLPGMSGPEMVSEAIKVKPGLRILFMSGYTQDSIVDRTPWSRKVAFLEKPFNSFSISKKVREVLDRAHAGQTQTEAKNQSDMTAGLVLEDSQDR